ncbi:hypothetical protein MBCUT_01600 [Methanobrevibacter cuticularis]|uniref:Uncharacterized protein n=1 Tax=Methanobrevibacter cuticularis TaxID=47311 RepID=A0A166FHK7_9EURY|nr:hypothetical protein [Methanobrevibacter cuticularis]KZX17682.1 hypothetical protein MBCUT_01600 [Methanobrevibacter cuticularis]
MNTSGDVLYTFVTNNEVQNLEEATILPPPIPPTPPEPTPTQNQVVMEHNNNPTVQGSMKPTGVPIVVIIMVLLSIMGLTTYNRKK